MEECVHRTQMPLLPAKGTVMSTEHRCPCFQLPAKGTGMSTGHGCLCFQLKELVCPQNTDAPASS